MAEQELFDTPVLFLIFNRPQTTEKVFAAIRKQRPMYLFIAADGPRPGVAGDCDQCARTRACVANVDWPCEVKTLFQQDNQGCGKANAAAISWFFEQVEKGIILEDDCLPNPSFFVFCKELLDKYQDQQEVMMICGTSYQVRPLNSDTYYFSKYPHVWAWASWRRAWAHYRLSLEGEDERVRKKVLQNTFILRREQKFWNNNLNAVLAGLNTWDYQWMYWIWKNKGLCAVPWKNMIGNIGFGEDATHTTDGDSIHAAMQQYEMPEIIHPGRPKIHRRADTFERYTVLIAPLHRHYRQRWRNLVFKISSLFKKR